ncbi:MAG TPA: hypothetical protein VIL97_07235, partial [Thermoanaerobaculia bacterium]
MLNAFVLATLVIASQGRLAAELDAITLRIDERQQTEDAAFIVRGAEGALNLVRWPATGRFRSTRYAGVVPAGTIAIVHT